MGPKIPNTIQPSFGMEMQSPTVTPKLAAAAAVVTSLKMGRNRLVVTRMRSRCKGVC